MLETFRGLRTRWQLKRWERDTIRQKPEFWRKLQISEDFITGLIGQGHLTLAKTCIERNADLENRARYVEFATRRGPFSEPGGGYQPIAAKDPDTHTDETLDRLCTDDILKAAFESKAREERARIVREAVDAKMKEFNR